MTKLFIAASVLIALVPGGHAVGISARRGHVKRAASIAGFRENRGWPGFAFPKDPWGLVMDSKVNELAEAAAALATGSESGEGAVEGAPPGQIGSSFTLATPVTTFTFAPVPSSAVLPLPSSVVNASSFVNTSSCTSSSPKSSSSSSFEPPPQTSSIAPSPSTSCDSPPAPTSSGSLPAPASSDPPSSPPSAPTHSDPPPAPTSSDSPSPPPTTQSQEPSPSPLHVPLQKSFSPSPSPSPASTPVAAAQNGESDSSTPSGDGSGDTSGPTSAGDIALYLSAHNAARAAHGATPLTYSQSLAAKAQQWANGCVFKHSGGTLGPFGENLAAGTGDGYGIKEAIASWTGEASSYDPNNPVPSHFTQIVWKATTEVGCALQNCNGIFDASFGLAHYYVCEYSPQGNVIGEFGTNVQA